MIHSCREYVINNRRKSPVIIDFSYFPGRKFVPKLIFLSLNFLNYDTFLRQIVLLHHKFFIFANDLNFKNQNYYVRHCIKSKSYHR